MSGGNASSPADAPVTGRALRAVARFAAREKLFRGIDHLLVAVSGGPDSVACLLLLLGLRQRFGFEVSVAHFDHGLREGSARDLEFVRSLCERLGVKCLTAEGDTRSFAAEHKLGIEDAARRMRYQFLAFAAAKEDAGAVVTGHTAGDQAETVLMRVLRGTGVRGLRGILPSSAVPGAPTQRLLRPLLGIRRSDTAAICAEAGIEPLADPTNLDIAFARNRVRHEALAALRAINPAVGDALVGLGESARELFAPVERLALGTRPESRGPGESIFTLGALSALPNEAVTLVLEREAAFHGCEPEVNRTRVRNLRTVLERGTGEVLFGGLAVEASSGKVRVGTPPPPLAAFDARPLNVPGATLAGLWRVEVSTAPFPALAGASVVTIDTSTLRGVLRVRTLAPGDRLTVRGLSRKISDVLLEARVPRWERRSLLAITDANGVLAIAGGAVAVSASPDSAEALWVRVLPASVTR